MFKNTKCKIWFTNAGYCLNNDNECIGSRGWNNINIMIKSNGGDEPTAQPEHIPAKVPQDVATNDGCGA